MWLPIVFGGNLINYFCPSYAAETTFGANRLLMPVDSISAYFLTTSTTIVTKLDKNIKQIWLYTNCRIREQRGVTWDT